MWSVHDIIGGTRRQAESGERSSPHPSRPGTSKPGPASSLIATTTASQSTGLGQGLLAALLAATLGPLAALLYSQAVGNPVPPLAKLAWAYLPSLITALVVALSAITMRHVGRGDSSRRRLGAYELIRKLGEGGMGEVWEAVHHSLGRTAAIKLIRPDYLSSSSDDGTTARRRFEREARVTAKLQSKHTVQVYDFGTTGDGTFFYAMEMLRGYTMAELVEKVGPLSEARTIHLLKQAVDSLCDAHEAGLIHRDIKPANLHVGQYGHTVDMVKVLDFGLVKSTGDLLGDETQLTQAGATTGTPAYMAPETLLGNKAIDGRADIYALGCVAYFLLTGQKVFDEDTVMRMALAHVGTSPEPPSARAPRPVSAGLDELIMACLAKDPDARPQSAAELLERLEALQSDTTWTARRAKRWGSSRDTRSPQAPLGCHDLTRAA